MRDFGEERSVYTYLRFHLSRTYKVYVSRRVKGLGLPDIDLLLVSGDELTALEVKYFSDSSLLKPYSGLDEALALLLYGVDRSYLLHVFDSCLADKASDYARRALMLVNLTPIGYMVMIGRGELEVLRQAPPNPLLRGERRKEVLRARVQLLKEIGTEG